MSKMERLLGKRFPFKDCETGEMKQLWTENGLTWFTKIIIPKLDEDLEETDEMVESDQAIAYEVLIVKYRPLDEQGREFTRWALQRIAKGLVSKAEIINKYCLGLR